MNGGATCPARHYPLKSMFSGKCSFKEELDEISRLISRSFSSLLRSDPLWVMT